ncbi:unnamed protein product, partial [Anisakis simplex]|uniref:TGF_BETA_2 domain-containing protein n=1 Tax=Anisakis simplex TaxID=6269 RepID=A0A0M3JB42_ANISI
SEFSKILQNFPKTSQKIFPPFSPCFDNFIIAPHGYSANYCAGRCAKHENMNGHRRLLQNITEPCCAPAKYDPFEVLYAVSETDIRKRLLHGITVSECGCLA